MDNEGKEMGATIIDFVHVAEWNGTKITPSNGRHINFLDYSQYFNQYDNVRNLLLVEKELTIETERGFFDHPTITTLRRLDNDYNNEQFFLNDYTSVNDNQFRFNNNGDILLCDFFTLYLMLENHISLNVYDHVVCMDCLELTIFFRNLPSPQCIRKMGLGLRPRMMMKLSNLKSLTFLATPYNKNDIEQYGFKYVEYFRKINFDLFDKEYIDSISRSDELIYYYSRNNLNCDDGIKWLESIQSQYPDIILTDNYMDIWQHNNILYTPKPYVGYIEQFGRMLFEAEHFGIKCHINKECSAEDKSGMDYYLDYYHINNDMDIKSENFLDVIEGAIHE